MALAAAGEFHVPGARLLRRRPLAPPPRQAAAQPRGAPSAPSRPGAQPGAAAAAAAAAAAVAAAAGSGRHGRRCRSLARRAAAAAAPFADACAAPYAVEPHASCSFGGYVDGFDLREVLGNPAMGSRLRKDMAKYRLLVFRGQEKMTGPEHIALSEMLGSMDHGLHKVHPRAEDPRLLRVSNDADQGFVQTGTSGWHVDGVMLKAPFAAQTMHHLSAIPGGDTLFLGLAELLEALEPEVAERLGRTWFVSGVGDVRRDGQLSLLPLVYQHPFTGAETMCFHLGQGYCLGWIEERPRGSGLAGLVDGLVGGSPGPCGQTLKRLLLQSADDDRDFAVLPPGPIQRLLKKAISTLGPGARERAVLRQEWRTGDLALLDNMALAHLPTPGTQAPPEGHGSPGLRLFHRTTMVDPAAEPRSLRGAASVLLAGPGAALDGVRAGAVEDPSAMRVILDGLTAAGGGGAASAKPKPPVKKDAPEQRKAMASRLRRKAQAGLEQRRLAE